MAKPGQFHAKCNYNLAFIQNLWHKRTAKYPQQSKHCDVPNIKTCANAGQLHV